MVLQGLAALLWLMLPNIIPARSLGLRKEEKFWSMWMDDENARVFIAAPLLCSVVFALVNFLQIGNWMENQ